MKELFNEKEFESLLIEWDWQDGNVATETNNVNLIALKDFINSSIRKAQCEAVMEVLGSLNFDDDADMGNNRIEANHIRAKYQEGK